MLGPASCLCGSKPSELSAESDLCMFASVYIKCTHLRAIGDREKLCQDRTVRCHANVSCVTCFRFPTIAWRCTKPGCVQLPRPRAQREDKPAPWEPLHTSQVSMRWQRSRYVAMQCYQRSQVNYGFTWRKRSPGQLLADQEGGVQKQNKAQGVLCRLRQGKKLSATNSLRQPLQAESMYVTLSPFSL